MLSRLVTCCSTPTDIEQRGRHGQIKEISDSLPASHTNHNQNKKAHRNGIKKPRKTRTRSLRGFRRNARFALVGSHKARAEQRAAAAAA
ncbi:RPL29 [Sanghuangporus weigelae]